MGINLNGYVQCMITTHADLENDKIGYTRVVRFAK